METPISVTCFTIFVRILAALRNIYLAHLLRPAVARRGATFVSHGLARLARSALHLDSYANCSGH